MKGIARKESYKLALIRDVISLPIPTLIVMGEVVLQSSLEAITGKVFTFTEMNSISVSASLPLIAIGFLFASGRQSGLAQHYWDTFTGKAPSLKPVPYLLPLY